MERTMRGHTVLVACSIAWVACTGAAPEQAPAPAAVVDSVLPMEVALERFRSGLPEPERLESGASDMETLVRRVVDALVRNDTLVFERLAVNRAEFAWLYFPTTRVAQPPYELPPALAWFQMQQRSRRGVFRALAEFGGVPLQYRGYRCDPEPTVEGGNRIWIGCRVELARPGGEPAAVRIFGAVLERDGRFAILSYDNDF
ncbi:MAG: hypothetical protein DIU52_005690 [bacterium]|jgi:hypothetical protein